MYVFSFRLNVCNTQVHDLQVWVKRHAKNLNIFYLFLALKDIFNDIFSV